MQKKKVSNRCMFDREKIPEKFERRSPYYVSHMQTKHGIDCKSKISAKKSESIRLTIGHVSKLTPNIAR